ncbi:dnaJ homolog subfamily C member 10-like [Anoplophora glabripennis]|uniref:dnaJ homolog subfamily C member 10-like n=1 Tax=Anoplophora glabripennis TaxID=217634 RepID=UPI000874CBE6|nr:dnaJ homolog subfamily C member 10-like [Anoplophora glabripennis]
MKLCIGSLLIVLFCVHLQAEEEDDYYKLLGVGRDATVKEIRKAFKVLAVKLHPDKNQDDKNAGAVFVKLARAYEVLKDPQTRKHYDLHGDSPDSVKKQQYHSYTYYRDQFGIYDDDPIIVTLSRNDYELNVLDNNQAWFVNFYSPNCHHCHELAPTWRKLARELEGVIRIGAVNCEDDYALCYQLSIEAYPTLLYYEKESHVYEGERYRGDRSVEALEDFVLSKIKVDIEEISSSDWENLDFDRKQWLLFLCGDNNVNCPERKTMTKLAASLEGLISTGIVNDETLCVNISPNYKDHPIAFWQVKDGKIAVHSIKGADTKEILENVLNKLPNPKSVDAEGFKKIRTGLRDTSKDEKPWLLCFYLGAATELNLQLKRLPAFIPNIKIGLIHCGKNSALCATLNVVRYPTWGILKVGGAFELHQGRDILHEVAAFARDGVKAVNFHALSPADFNNLIKDGTPWLVDWYAPWCPPCRKVMPELRKASQEFDSEKVKFGTIDCTLHRALCSAHGINSYPTIVLYNNSQVHKFHSVPNAASIAEFVNDMINPIVLSLDEVNFAQITRKRKDELWAVDFYAPWCGPCQKLAPEWRKFAKEVTQFPEVKIAQVDCVANAELCNAQNIRSYPTIRLYPLGSRGLTSVAIYTGNRDSVSLKRWLLSFLPTSIESFTAEDFRQNILTKNYFLPWLVDFYAPWCGHCTHFEPEFRVVAQRLEGRVRTAKIDCEAERVFCGRQGITGYPTLRLYLSPKEFFTIDNQDAAHILRRVKEIVEQYKHKQHHDEL